MAAFVNFEHIDWDDHLPEADFFINTTKQSTKELSSFELV